MPRLILAPDTNPQTFDLTDSVTFGSDEGCTFRVRTLEARHAAIVKKGGRFYLEAMEGSSGVMLNGRAIEFEPLSDGDVVEIGGQKLLFNPALPAEAVDDDDEDGSTEIGESTDPTGRTHYSLGFATVRVLRGNEPVTTQTIEGDTNLLGRSRKCAVVLDDNAVSGRHARIRYTREAGFTLEDLQSSNGTYVNGEKIETTTLHNLDTILIGPFTIVFESDAAAIAEDEGTAAEGGDATAIWTGEKATSYPCKLIIIDHQRYGEELLFDDDEVTLGRDDTADVTLSHESVSRHHATLKKSGDSYTLTDNESANGTSRNGRPVTEPVTLATGDKVRFGRVNCFFVQGGHVYMLPSPGDVPEPVDDTPPPNRLRQVLVALVAIMSVATVAVLMLDSGEEPLPDVPVQQSDPGEVSPLLLQRKIEEAVEIQDWDTCIEEARRYLNEVGDDAEIAYRVEECQREKAFQDQLIRANRLAEAQNFPEAIKAYQGLYDSEAYGSTARQGAGQVRQEAIAFYVSEGDALMAEGKCGEAIGYYDFALDYDEKNDAIIRKKLEAEQACQEPTRRPRRGPTGPGDDALAARALEAARTAFSQGNLPEALRKVTEVLERDLSAGNADRRQAQRALPLLRDLDAELENADREGTSATGYEARREAILTARRLGWGMPGDLLDVSGTVGYFVRKGEGLLAQGSHPQAYAAFEKALQLDPDQPTARRETNAIDEEVEELMIQIKINSKNRPLQEELAQQVFALVPPSHQDYREARKILDRGL